MLMLIVNEVW